MIDDDLMRGENKGVAMPALAARKSQEDMNQVS
jgi:hypothetical protein